MLCNQDIVWRATQMTSGRGMFESFEEALINVGETTVFTRRRGSGPPVLMLHGFPETHLMWHAVAPRLADIFTVICADLRGYGASGKPVSTLNHAPYAKTPMAHDMVCMMERLGFSRFGVAGHDRGGRVAYRMALDYPENIERLAVLDIIPTGEAFGRADMRLALGYWPWSLLSQPEPLPERMIISCADAVVDSALQGWGSDQSSFPPDYAPPTSRRCRTRRRCMRSARSIAQQQHSTSPKTYRIGRHTVGLRAQSSCCGVKAGRSIVGMRKQVDRLGFGEIGRTL